MKEGERQECAQNCPRIIGHEIRNPMTTVRGYLQYISKKGKYADEAETFQLMIEELDRANEIITEYVSLSQDRVVDLKRTNLNTVIHHLYPLLSVHTYIQQGNVILEVEDQGRGIPNEIKDKVGTPFFTTKLNGPVSVWLYAIV